MSLSKDAILTADDLKRVEVPVPEWSGAVWVTTLDGEKLDRLQELRYPLAGEQIRFARAGDDARMVAFCACDETGKPLFTEADVPTLLKRSGAALRRIAEAARKLNFGRTDEDAEKN